MQRESSAREIRGWAIADGGRKIATVALCNGRGEILEKKPADIFRADLKQKGIIEHGVGGFQFAIPETASENDLRIELCGTSTFTIPKLKDLSGGSKPVQQARKFEDD
ncbi:hypothetical protein [Aestuariivirga sp.]|uniref:hypothetical protein n=1 Tax=Aestuariivirga sp. TaxID=2650926 RepID=UPI0039E5637A